MDAPNIYYFQNLGFNMRLTDLRPKAEKIQLNIYNSQDSGHSLMFVIETTSETPASLEEVRLGISDNILADCAAKAKSHFEILGQ
jgi:hypothetical protein